MGHSAGAVHVASYVADSQFHGLKGIGLAGAILLSGLYDLTSMTPGAPEKAYFGEDTSKHAERSSLAGLLKTHDPAVGGLCRARSVRSSTQQAKQLNAALCKAGRCPRFVTLAKHSHMSEVYAINTKDTSLSGEILAFVKGK